MDNRLESFSARSAEALGAIASPNVAYAGAWALGAFLGFITLALLSRTGTNALTLASIITALLGAAVFAALSKGEGGPASFSWYFIGLFSGLLLFVALAVTGQLPKLDVLLSPGASPVPTPSATPLPTPPPPTSS